MSPEERQQRLQAARIMSLLGFGPPSRVEKTKETHPDFYKATETFATTGRKREQEEGTSRDIVQELNSLSTPSILLFINIVALESHIGVKVDHGPLAAMVALAEWLWDHPEIESQIINDPEYIDTLNTPTPPVS